MWKRKAMPLVQQPGPQKIIPQDYGRLKQDIEQLSHGKSSTEGTRAVYLSHSSSISRRQLQKMITMARHDLNAAHRQNLRRIRWNIPNIAWSMNPTEYDRRDKSTTRSISIRCRTLPSGISSVPWRVISPAARKSPAILQNLQTVMTCFRSISSCRSTARSITLPITEL